MGRQASRAYQILPPTSLTRCPPQEVSVERDLDVKIRSSQVYPFPVLPTRAKLIVGGKVGTGRLWNWVLRLVVH